jgi:hypothetical protein
VLEYDPGFEIEARFTSGARGRSVSWIGFAGRVQGDPIAPSVTAAALEASRVAGDRDGPVDPTALDPSLKAHAWLKVCVDDHGRVTSAQVRETTSSVAARAFLSAASGWTFKPFLVHGEAAPVCGMFAMAYPPGHSADKQEKLPIPMTLQKDQVLVPEQELKRVSGNKWIEPPAPMAWSGRMVGTFKVCLDTTGKPAEVRALRTTGSPAYDEKVISTITETWAYTPVIIDGHPIAMCTQVTFIYTQS